MKGHRQDKTGFVRKHCVREQQLVGLFGCVFSFVSSCLQTLELVRKMEGAAESEMEELIMCRSIKDSII